MRAICRSVPFALAVLAIAATGCNVDNTEVIDNSQSKFIVPSEGAELVPDEYIVVFQEQAVDNKRAGSVDYLARSIMKARGLSADQIFQTYNTALPGFAATMSRAQAEQLALDSSIKYIEPNQYVHVDETWGLDRVDQRFLPLDNANFASAGDYAGNGSGAHAYIIDTGVWLTHNEFTGRTGDGYDFVDNDADPTDCNGHGTHVAGTIAGTTYGLAKGATVHGVRVLDCGGSGTYANVIAGIDWVTNNHQSPAVANMSLGGGASQSVNDAVTASVAAGVVHAVAAGNDYGANACNSSPAGTPDALTVGSTTSSDARSSFSNVGTCVDLFAPGSSITSAWYGSNNATNTISGTSMATPHVAGGATLYRANNPGADAYAVNDAIVTWATEGRVSDPGTGSPNRLLYVGDQVDTPPPPPPPACSDPATCENVFLTIVLDNYPGETSWEIATASGAVVASGGGYSGAGSTVNETIALDPGDYTFTIYDSFGDGVCCAYGAGSYELTDSSGNVLASGGEFASSESTPFTVDGGGGGVCLPSGSTCNDNADCCSNKCRGRRGSKTCS